jgi:hypothetical protein
MEKALGCNNPRSFTAHHEHLLWISRTLVISRSRVKARIKHPKYRGARHRSERQAAQWASRYSSKRRLRSQQRSAKMALAPCTCREHAGLFKTRINRGVAAGLNDAEPRCPAIDGPAVNRMSSCLAKGSHRVHFRRAACREIAGQRGHYK